MYHNKIKTFDKASTFCIGLIFILFLCLLGTINYLDTQLIETLNKQLTTLTPTTTTTTTTTTLTPIIMSNPVYPKVYTMRVTGYTYEHGKKSAIMDKIQADKTAAVSPECIELLGEKIYVSGHGIRYVNDLTASWLDEKFDICTIDLAVGSASDLKKIGNETKKVVRLHNSY